MRLMYLIFSFLTAVICQTMYGNFLYTLLAFIFTPVAWIKWFLFHEITLQVLREAFPGFF